jgi:hypothetical protein
MAIGVPGTHGRIAFAGDAAGHLDIRTINPDSSRGNERQGRCRRSRDARRLT